MSTDIALWRSGLLKVIQPIAPSVSAFTRGVLLNKAVVLSEVKSFVAHGEPVLILEILQPRIVARVRTDPLGVDLVELVARSGEEREEVLEQIARLDVRLAVLELHEPHGVPADQRTAAAQHLEVVALGVDLEEIDLGYARFGAIGIEGRQAHPLDLGWRRDP